MIHIVTGPPCSGKSRYIHDHAMPNDVIIDLDALFACLGSADDHDAPYPVWKCAIEAREAAIDAALAMGCEAWIAHTRPTKDRVYDYVQADAEFIDIDADRETCIARAKADGRPQRTLDAIGVYFDSIEG